MDELKPSWPCLYGLLIFILIVLSGCSSVTRVPIPYTWVDSPVHELTQSWGVPDGVVLNERDNPVLMYIFRKQVLFERAPVDVNWRSGIAEFRESGAPEGRQYSMTCAVFYEVQDSYVVGWDWRGARCTSTLPNKLRRRPDDRNW